MGTGLHWIRTNNLKWSRIVTSAVLLLSLLISQAMAVNIDYVLEWNVAKEAQWVNWIPDSFSPSESVMELAKQLSAETDIKEQIPKLVHDWVCENIYYDRTDLETQSYSMIAATDVLRERRGVCEGIANLVQALLIANNIPCIKVWGVAIEEGNTWETADVNLDRVNHTWNEYYVSGEWASMDCTMDMGNQYAAGAFRDEQWRSDYFNPDAVFFAETHFILQRGFDLSKNVPNDWAKPEVKTALDMDIVPLNFFLDYRAYVTASDFSLLFDLPLEETNNPISRCQAALLLAPMLNDSFNVVTPYLDIGSCTAEEQAAIGTLFHCGIMMGDGLHFMPDVNLARQEALAIIARIHRLER